MTILTLLEYIKANPSVFVKNNIQRGYIEVSGVGIDMTNPDCQLWHLSDYLVHSYSLSSAILIRRSAADANKPTHVPMRKQYPLSLLGLFRR